ncbi:MAG: hypothetical protein AAFQ01_04110 [Bacteroidota bacterium]
MASEPVGVEPEPTGVEKEGSLWDYTQGGLQSTIRAIPGIGDLAGDLLFGSEAAASLRIQQRILKTNSTTLGHIRAVAHDALKVKKKIEELNRLRRDAIRLGKRLKQTNYLKVLMGIGENLLKIDVNPGAYVPHTEYTKDLKNDVNVDLSKEKGLLLQSEQFFKQTRKALAIEAGKYPDYPSFASAYQKAKAHDRSTEVHLTRKKVALAQYYEQLADSLLSANEELKALLDKKESGMSTAEAVRAYQTISENTQKAAELKEKACRLLEEAGRLSVSDEEALRATGRRLAAQALLEEEINWYEQQN